MVPGLPRDARGVPGGPFASPAVRFPQPLPARYPAGVGVSAAAGSGNALGLRWGWSRAGGGRVGRGIHRHRSGMLGAHPRAAAWGLRWGGQGWSIQHHPPPGHERLCHRCSHPLDVVPVLTWFRGLRLGLGRPSPPQLGGLPPRQSWSRQHEGSGAVTAVSHQVGAGRRAVALSVFPGFVVQPGPTVGAYRGWDLGPSLLSQPSFPCMIRFCPSTSCPTCRASWRWDRSAFPSCDTQPHVSPPSWG